jgi:hypothetical protein
MKKYGEDMVKTWGFLNGQIENQDEDEGWGEKNLHFASIWRRCGHSQIENQDEG